MITDLPKRPRNVDFDGRSFTIDEMRFLGSQTTFVTLGFKNCPIGDAHIAALRALPRLLRLWLEGTQITDAALGHLATFPKLEFLILDRTRITGEGFRHFHDHKALKSLWASETDVTDQTVTLAASIPKLSILRIAKTAVTFEGLLALAASPRLKVNADEQFSADQMREYEAAQRRLARQARGSVVASGDDSAAAKSVLLAFFDAMNEWELSMATDDVVSPRTKVELEERRANEKASCAAIFEKYCTSKERVYGRPNVLSYSRPPGYTQEAIVDAEQHSTHKVFIYTKDRSGFQRRYLLSKSKDGWKVDHRECLLDGWSRDFL